MMLRPRALAVTSLALLLTAATAAAQVPPAVPDTLPPDTMPALPPADTLAADTLRPAVLFPAMPIAPAVRTDGSEWVWDREALLREAPTSLTDLLARIPGVVPLRAGMFAQPEAAPAFGMTSGRLEIEIDGFVLDPLAASTFDLAQIPLGQVREVRVERGIGLTRIRILSEAPEGPQPITRVEAGIGVPAATMFRGLFLVPHVIIGPLGLGIERLETDGFNRNQPASLFSGWGKWAWTDGDRGVQAEFWSGTLRRVPASPWPTERRRRDLIVRARNTFTTGLVGEVYAGQSTLTETPGTTPADTVRGERRSVQAGARAAYQMEQAVVSADVRLRTAEFLPSLEGVLRADTRLGPVRAGGELGYATWRDFDAAPFFAVRGGLDLVAGVSAFAELTGGRRGAPPIPPIVPQPGDPADDPPGDDPALPPPGPTAAAGLTQRTGWRAGLAAALGERATGSVSAVGFSQDLGRPFGLPFDTAGAALGVSSVRGVEAYGRIVLLPGFFALESWITAWQGADDWLYLPSRSWRTALELHTFPLASRNLEILGRLEVTQRGRMNAWGQVSVGEGDATEPALVTLPGYTQGHGYLHIRVIDVRAFIRWEDFLTRGGFEVLPGRIQRGPRFFYGVKWTLTN